MFEASFECRGNDDGRNGGGGGDSDGGGNGGGDRGGGDRGPRTNPDEDPGSWCEIPEGQEATICEHGDRESDPDGGGGILPRSPANPTSRPSTFRHRFLMPSPSTGRSSASPPLSGRMRASGSSPRNCWVSHCRCVRHRSSSTGTSATGTPPPRNLPAGSPTHPQYGSITHTYSDKGDRTVTLTTVYTGEYNYGGGWSPIAGTAAVASDGLSMTVYRYHKYRVEDDCNENPYGTDCAAG